MLPPKYYKEASFWKPLPLLSSCFVYDGYGYRSDKGYVYPDPGSDPQDPVMETKIWSMGHQAECPN